MKKILLVTLLVCVFVTFPVINSSAQTALWLEPLDQLYGPGDIPTVDLRADIDVADKIFGFGFDLSFDKGTTYISVPGEGGSYLTFLNFTPNSAYFHYDVDFPPLWDDGDTIAGEVPLGEEDVWGSNILLGTFRFEAPSTGPIGIESLYLGPPEGDYGPFGEEGLLGVSAVMPLNPEATVNPIPIPAAVWLFGSSLIGLVAIRITGGNHGLRTRPLAEPGPARRRRLI